MVQDWEQKHRQPDRGALILLTVIAHEPESVKSTLAHEEHHGKTGNENHQVWVADSIVTAIVARNQSNRFFSTSNSAPDVMNVALPLIKQPAH